MSFNCNRIFASKINCPNNNWWNYNKYMFKRFNVSSTSYSLLNKMKIIWLFSNKISAADYNKFYVIYLKNNVIRNVTRNNNAKLINDVQIRKLHQPINHAWNIISSLIIYLLIYNSFIAWVKLSWWEIIQLTPIITTHHLLKRVYVYCMSRKCGVHKKATKKTIMYMCSTKESRNKDFKH